MLIKLAFSEIDNVDLVHFSLYKLAQIGKAKQAIEPMAHGSGKLWAIMVNKLAINKQTNDAEFLIPVVLYFQLTSSSV